MQINKSNTVINRLKAVLAEESKTNKWLAEELSKNETIISGWCTNNVQPPIKTLVLITEILDVKLTKLFND